MLIALKAEEVKVLVTHLCLTLCDPIYCSLLGSSVHEILQAKILEWVAISFSGYLPNPGNEHRLLYCRQIFYHLSHQGEMRQKQYWKR